MQQVCSYCGVTFRRKDAEVKRNENRGVKSTYCSLKCHTESGRASSTCKYCNTVFKHTKSTGRKFCNKSCAAKFNNKNKSVGTRRSKLEVWIEEKFQKCFPDLQVNFNVVEVIGAELDIYIPCLKLAFELNGIFHYEPIFGQNKLTNIQRNDANKFQLCQQSGISLCIIDTSSQTIFSERSSLRFWAVIENIVTERLDMVAGEGVAPSEDGL